MDANRVTFSETVTFACPSQLRSALHEAAARQFSTVSQVIRRACLKELQASGVPIGEVNVGGERERAAPQSAG